MYQDSIYRSTSALLLPARLHAGTLLSNLNLTINMGEFYSYIYPLLNN